MQELSLSDLFNAPDTTGDGDVSADMKLSGITSDSRQVRPGSVFVAIKGNAVDGIEFVPDAIEKGAVVIVCGSGNGGNISSGTEDVAVVEVDDPRQTYSDLLAKFYPKQPEHMVAVTGTNGKTSIVFFCQQFWSLLGKRCASIGTMGVLKSGESDNFLSSKDSGPVLTTPDPQLLHQELAQLENEDVQYVALEASSHGLHQHRIDNIRIEAAGFTNLSHDHLDYHGSIEAYFEAKKLLFTHILPEGGAAVISADIEQFAALEEASNKRNHRIISYGRRASVLRLVDSQTVHTGQDLLFNIEGKQYETKTGLFGSFQLDNLQCAMGLVHSTGFSWDEIMKVLPHIEPVPGRLEHMHAVQDDIHVFVDYAHTPDALETVLKVLAGDKKGKLWVVFGCGGDRDTTKRPEMGAIAKAHADEIVITDDNPRTENAAAIRKAILEAVDDAKEIGNRAEAIAYAIEQADPGDVVLVAGKGHEQYQIVGADTLHFSDQEEVRKALRLRRKA